MLRVLLELDQHVVGLVGGKMEVRRRIFAGQGDVGGVAAVGHRQDATGVAGVGGVADGRRRSQDVAEIDGVVVAEAGQHAVEVDRVVDLQRAGGVGVELDVLAERADQIATTMSGGQQQMCAIGRGIMARPKLLLIDELSLGLAPKAVELLAESLIKINREGISILLVEQDVMTAFEIASTGYVLESGRVRLHGDTRQLMHDPSMQSAYMGL